MSRQHTKTSTASKQPLDTSWLTQGADPNQTYWCELPYAILKISGEDARTFLQGQVTCNLKTLTPSQPLYGAHCNLKGRAIATFLLLDIETAICLICPHSTLTTLLDSLKKYSVFSKIDFRDISSETSMFGLLNKQSDVPHPPTATSFDLQQYQLLSNDSSIPVPTLSLLLTTDKATTLESLTAMTNTSNCAVACWELACIDSHLILLEAQLSEHYIPIELNMDRNGGIDFQKGCYIGQEIIARLHYKGKAKSRLKTISISEITTDATLEALPIPLYPYHNSGESQQNDEEQSKQQTKSCGQLLRVAKQNHSPNQDSVGRAAAIIRQDLAQGCVLSDATTTFKAINT